MRSTFQLFVAVLLATLLSSCALFNNKHSRPHRTKNRYDFFASFANTAAFQRNQLHQNNDATGANLDEKFNLQHAIALGAFAFDAYNDIDDKMCKLATGLDRTNVHFVDDIYPSIIYEGILTIKVKAAKIYNNNKQTTIEGLISGNEADPYVQLATFDSNSFCARNTDSAQTTIKENNNLPKFDEEFSLYVRNFSRSFVEFRCFDHERLRDDHLIGSGVLSIKDIMSHTQTIEALSANAGVIAEVDDLLLPLYADVDNSTTSVDDWGSLFNLHKSEASKKSILGSRKRVGTISVSVTVRTLQSAVATSDKGDVCSSWPKGGMPAVLDWSPLLQQVLSTSNASKEKSRLLISLADGALQKVCFLESLQSDCQASLYADIPRRLLLLAFRGTEMNKLQDIATDINLLQTRFPALGDELLVHAGFLRSYQSIQSALLQQLAYLLEGADGGCMDWQLYVTGHSLGGALAKLCAYDLMRIANDERMSSSNASVLSKGEEKGRGEGVHYVPLSSYRSHYCFDASFKSNRSLDPAALYFLCADAEDGGHAAIGRLRRSRLAVYSFGAPRVGNEQFKRAFDLLVPRCFRLVNRQDLVARLPRSLQHPWSLGSLPSYDHVGKTVLIAEDNAEDASTSILVQGENVDACPLDDHLAFDPVSNLPFIGNNSDSFSFNALDALKNAAQDNVGSVDLMRSALESMQSKVREFVNNDRDVSTESAPFSLLTKMGTNVDRRDLVAKEWQFLLSILNFSALLHHLEPSYFQALNRTLCSLR